MASWITNRVPYDPDNSTYTLDENLTIIPANYLDTSLNAMTFNGDGYTITISGFTNFTGLFSTVSGGSTVHDLSVVSTNSDLSSSKAWLAKDVTKSTVRNCHVSGGMTNLETAGFVYRAIDSSLQNCYSTGDITGENAAGVCFWSDNGIVENCHSTGGISGLATAGICYRSDISGRIRNCHSTGNITGEQAAGICYQSTTSGLIENCYSTGNITGENAAGICYWSNISGKIENCYTVCNITGENAAGICFWSYINGIVENCYTVGNITGNNAAGICLQSDTNGRIEKCITLGTTGATSFPILRARVDTNVVSDCIYNGDSLTPSGALLSGEAVYTQNMDHMLIDNSLYIATQRSYSTPCISLNAPNGSNYLDFSVTTQYTGSMRFVLPITDPTVYLDTTQLSACGSGVYDLGTRTYPVDKYSLRNNSSDATWLEIALDSNDASYSLNTYKLLRDIVVESPFTDTSLYGKTFDGSGHTITISNISDFTGLFSNTNGSTLSNLILNIYDSSLTTNNAWLTRELRTSTLINCALSGDVTTTQCAGLCFSATDCSIINCNMAGKLQRQVAGICYKMHNDGRIVDCHSNCSFKGENPAGIVNILQHSTIQNCYVSGNIVATDAAGLCHSSYDASILNCYYLGNITGNTNTGIVRTAEYTDINKCITIGTINSTGAPIVLGNNSSNVSDCVYYGTVLTPSGALQTGEAVYTQNMDHMLIDNSLYIATQKSYNTSCISLNTPIGSNYLDFSVSPAFTGAMRFVIPTTDETVYLGSTLLTHNNSVYDLPTRAYPVNDYRLTKNLSWLTNNPAITYNTGVYTLTANILIDVNDYIAHELLSGETFNGNGLSITLQGNNLLSNAFTGLFYLQGGTILNVNIVVTNTTQTLLQTHGWLCEASSFGTVIRCTSNGNVPGSGGLMGDNFDGDVLDCDVTGIISGVGSGGIVGKDSSGTITRCTNSGLISGDSAGGIAGSGYDGDIKNCENNGTINGVGAGGITGSGFVSGNIQACNNSSTINGNTAGGICGISCTGIIISCSNTGAINGTYAGGIAGNDVQNAIISKSYSTGIINGMLAGGIVGGNSVIVEIINCYVTGDVSGNGAGGIIGGSAGISEIPCVIKYCSYLGVVSGTNAGGLFGSNPDNILAQYCFILGTNTAGNIFGINIIGSVTLFHCVVNNTVVVSVNATQINPQVTTNFKTSIDIDDNLFIACVLNNTHPLQFALETPSIPDDKYLVFQPTAGFTGVMRFYVSTKPTGDLFLYTSTENIETLTTIAEVGGNFVLLATSHTYIINKEYYIGQYGYQPLDINELAIDNFTRLSANTLNATSLGLSGINTEAKLQILATSFTRPTDSTGLAYPSPCLSAYIRLNGQERFAPRPGSYFNWLQCLKHHTNIPKSQGIHVYSFAQFPESHQPSGSCNFSRIDSAYLCVTFPSNIPAGTLTAYGYGYNVLRVSHGMGGTAYSN